MKVFKRPGSSHYAYKFQHRGKEYYRSTGTVNRREAESIASAARARVVRQAAGLEEPEPQRQRERPQELRKVVPTLRDFQATFNDWVGTAKAEQKRTVKFYQESYQKLLTYGPWADLRLGRDRRISYRKIQDVGLEARWTPQQRKAYARDQDDGEPLSRYSA
jgi:hypothetical protein